MTTQTLVAQLLASQPEWVQWLLAVLSVLFGPTLLALAKSESLALNNSTAANGILHGWRLAKAALAVVPQADKPEPDPKAEQIAALEAQLAELKGEVTNV